MSAHVMAFPSDCVNELSVALKFEWTAVAVRNVATDEFMFVGTRSRMSGPENCCSSELSPFSICITEVSF